MRKVAVYGRRHKRNDIGYIKQLFDTLNEYQFEIHVFNDFYEFLKKDNNYVPSINEKFTSYKDLRQDIDFVISIGGDGTFLDTLSLVRNTNIPVIGINSGKLGFLASISKEDIQEAVKSLYNKNYSTEKRSLLKMESEQDIFPDFKYALNDMTIQKKRVRDDYNSCIPGWFFPEYILGRWINNCYTNRVNSLFSQRRRPDTFTKYIEFYYFTDFTP